MLFTRMPATLTRDEMRLYQRARRARLKAEGGGLTAKKSTRKVGFINRPKTAEEKSWDAQIDAIDARGGQAEWTGNGFKDASASKPAARPAAPLILTPASRSMVAVGGRAADRSGFASIATETAAFRANVTASLNRLAQEAVEARREREAQERRIVALEAAAERSAHVNQFVQAVAGLFSYAVRR
jgi:hypothetical protein